MLESWRTWTSNVFRGLTKLLQPGLKVREKKIIVDLINEKLKINELKMRSLLTEMQNINLMYFY